MAETYIASGPHFTDLANEVSDAINKAIRRGMEPEAAVCVAATVAADYGRGYYGNRYLADLAQIVIKRAAAVMPADAS